LALKHEKEAITMGDGLFLLSVFLLLQAGFCGVAME